MTTLAEDLAELRRLKDAAEGEGKEKKEADATFKNHMARCLQRMEVEQCESFRTSGYLFSVVEKVKGQIEDRRPYVRWALENDPAIVEFISTWCQGSDPRMEDDFFDAITSTSIVEYKEKTDILNQQARSHVNDGAPLPPGLTFRPDPYVGMRKS